MKRMLFLMMLVASFASAQNKPVKTDDIYFVPEHLKKSNQQQTNVFASLKITDPAAEIEHIKLNLNLYYRQRQKGLYIIVAGMATTTAAMFIKDPDIQTTIYAVGGGVSLAGLITFIDAGKHIRNAAAPR